MHPRKIHLCINTRVHLQCRKDRPPSKLLQACLQNEAPTVDRGEGNMDSCSHAAESTDESEVATGS